MHVIKTIFAAIVLVIIVTLSLANHQPVTLSLVPEQLSRFVPFQTSATVPLFVVGILALAFGIVVGLVGEYLREAGIRREVTRKQVQVESLKRENDQLAQKAQHGENEILALVNNK